MKTATITIRRDARQALDKMGKRFIETWKTGKATDTLIQFESPKALFRVLTPKRWELIEHLFIYTPSPPCAPCSGS